MNMQQMVQAMQKMQRQYEKEHKMLEETDFEYTANGAVKIVLKGNLEMVSLEFLDEELLKDDPEMVSDMIKLAYQGARSQIQAAEDALEAKFQQNAKGKGGMMF
ncbi:MAG: YbaB/EbfC family nucleoid-associated protein [Bacilli bacterium]|nr:YbaB/EbfC family nucleoid-associated protein [Bacilli bacterium]